MHYEYKDMPKKYDKATLDTWIKEQFKEHEAVEYHTMLENLAVLEKWCESHQATAFFKYFQDAVIGAHCRALHYKEKTWSAKNASKNENEDEKKWWKKLLDAATLGAPVILPLFTTLMDRVEKVEIEMPQFLAAVAIGAGISLPLGIFKRRTQEKEEAARAAEKEEARHKYDETWIRHTLCDARLRLALSKFVALPDPTKTDYNELVQSTFAILEQNLDQFSVNLCPNGMAERPNTFACEDNDD